MHPCAFLSRRLSPTERNYDMGIRELLAVKVAWRNGDTGWSQPNFHSLCRQITKTLISNRARDWTQALPLRVASRWSANKYIFLLWTPATVSCVCVCVCVCLRVCVCVYYFFRKHSIWDEWYSLNSTVIGLEKLTFYGKIKENKVFAVFNGFAHPLPHSQYMQLPSSKFYKVSD